MYTIKNPETAIIKFRNEYLFLSNFYEGKIFTYKGCKFTNTEAAFHSQKDPKRIKEFQMLRPSQSKKLGRKVNLRDDWEEVKDQIMYEVCYAKFTQDLSLKSRLLNTGDVELIEGNNHGDRCWGMTYDLNYKQLIGDNRLGIILMKIRDDLRNQ